MSIYVNMFVSVSVSVHECVVLSVTLCLCSFVYVAPVMLSMCAEKQPILNDHQTQTASSTPYAAWPKRPLRLSSPYLHPQETKILHVISTTIDNKPVRDSNETFSCAMSNFGA